MDFSFNTKEDFIGRRPVVKMQMKPIFLNRTTSDERFFLNVRIGYPDRGGACLERLTIGFNPFPEFGGDLHAFRADCSIGQGFDIEQIIVSLGGTVADSSGKRWHRPDSISATIAPRADAHGVAAFNHESACGIAVREFTLGRSEVSNGLAWNIEAAVVDETVRLKAFDGLVQG